MDWAAKRDRHTVIVFFGDHLPPLNQGYTETGFLKEPVPDRREPPEALAQHRETPLVVWSNKNGPMKDVGAISPSLIPLKLFQAAGIEHPYYTGFLGRVDARYDVIERHVLIAPIRRDARLVAAAACRPADQRLPPAAIRRAVRQAADGEALLPQPAEACGGLTHIADGVAISALPL